MDHHLIGGDGAPTRRNRRNGRTTKRVKTDRGSIEIATPRDRDGSFEPQLVKKRQTTLGPFLEEKILGLYAMGLSYADIRDHLAEMYGFELSGGKLSEITDAIIPELEAWRSRELAETYAFVWLDAIHIKVRD